MSVVSSYTTLDGIGSDRSFSYKYFGAKAHLQGGGWLGFRRIEATDNAAGIKTTTEYNDIYDGTHGLPNYQEIAAGNTVVKSIRNIWIPVPATTGAQIYAHLNRVEEKTFNLNGPPLTLVTYIATDYQCDAFGNQTSIVTNYNDGHTKTVSNTYSNDTGNWILGLLTQTQTTSVTPTQGTHTRVSTYTYEPGTPLVKTTTVEPSGGADITLTTTYDYDAFGNRTSSTLSGTGVASRTTTDNYDGRGQFVTSSTNAKGHSETKVYDPKWGVMTQLTGPNSLLTTWQYDGFGRKILEARADGTTTATTYTAATSGYAITTQTSGSPQTKIHYDILGRETRTETQGFDGTAVYKDTQYDAAGRVHRVSRNYFAGQTPPWTTHTYDAVGRVQTVTAPNGGQMGYVYNGLTTTITNALTQTRTEIKDAQGRLVQTTDALGGNTFYAYDPFGNLARVTDALGNITSITYDLRGRKIAMTDPDMGTWSYGYNPFGELVRQTDAKGQTITVAYDPLGRMTSRSATVGGVPTVLGNWVYDTAVKGIGQIAQVTGPNGYVQTTTYDNVGRVSQVQTQINGETYSINTAYDSFSRAEIQTYPQTGFRTRNIYNVYGYLSEVRDYATNLPLWRATTANADLRITQATLGNVTTQRSHDPTTGRVTSIQTGTNNAIQNLSYQYDLLGNLLSRSDPNLPLPETFTYDALNRLKTVTGPAPKSYDYNPIGNVIYKSDVGNYTYGQSGAGPHAVTSTSGTYNGTYTYDANGGMLTGPGRSLSYTPFNKPSQFTVNGDTTTITYDPNDDRSIKTTPTETTVYISKLYERETSGTVIEHKHHVFAGKTMVALRIEPNNASPSTRYLHTDHLGSITAITDENGGPVEALSYDAHGKRREADGDDATGPIDSLTHHGYTGHEHDDNANLINMGARLYDPILGRFITPDTIVQNPGDGQTYNRYSYAGNNPLLYTDPTGNCSVEYDYDCDSGSNTDPWTVWWNNFLNQLNKALHNSWNSVSSTNGSFSNSSGGGYGSYGGGYSDNYGFVYASDYGYSNRGSYYGDGGLTKVSSKGSEYRLIDPQPAGVYGSSITFENDVPGGPSTYMPIDPRLASAAENVAIFTGMTFNINSTTGGSGPHAEGRAVDINYINYMRVDNPLNVDSVRRLQEAFINQPYVNQVLGPVYNVNIWQGNVSPVTDQGLINQHRDHIHINVSR